ncbi:MAG TPA: cytochrome c oxidase subunit 3 [Pyrinomonadaceae bacterium]|jgi:heme/copper-type cytochrome/quinol oxidase subunit 3
MSASRNVIDVSEMPTHTFDVGEPVWWGNWGLLAIETTMFGILVATYFYLRQRYQFWPPPLHTSPHPFGPLPELPAATANVVLLLLGCIPMFVADRAARRGDRRAVRVGLALCLLFGAVSMTLRGFEFAAVKFRWDANAYGSVVWFTLGMHALHLLTVTLEVFLLTLWVFLRPFDMKHRVDITVVAVYWYWVVAVWLPLYAMVYFTPRLQ